MRIITNLRQLNKRLNKPVVCIGIFDGVHLGHKRILKKVVNEARRTGGTGLLITFDPHPVEVLDIIGSPPLLVSLKHRLKLIGAEGIDVACVLNFNKTFAKRSAEEFIRKVLIDKIGARAVIIGNNFRFGKGKTGDIKLLKSFGKKFGFSVNGVPLFKTGGAPVSSTRIRRAIMTGDLKGAGRLLGRRVSVLGTVVRGSRRGRILGYPTANINPHHEAIPPGGVYAVYIIVGQKKCKGVLNIGYRPTFRRVERLKSKIAEPTIEAHIFNFHKGIYGKDIEVIFIKRLRAEHKFPARKELIEQIKIDECNARMVL